MTPTFSFLILAYNRKSDVLTTVNKIVDHQNGVTCEIVVIDNGSKDVITEQELKEKTSERTIIKLIRLDKNIGISGWNEGARVAEGKYLWLLDDDSHPIDGSIERAQQMIRRGSYDAIACRVDHLPGASGLILGKEHNLKPCRAFCGCGVIISRESFLRLGGFWQRLFVYVHEKEFIVRYINEGYSITYAHNVVVEHRGESRVNTFKSYHEMRSTSLIYYRYLPFVVAIGFSILKLLWFLFIPKDITYSMKVSFIRGFMAALKEKLCHRTDRYKLRNATINLLFLRGKRLLNEVS